MPKPSHRKRHLNGLHIHMWQNNIAFRDLSKVSGVTVSRLTRLSHGQVEPTPEERRALSRALNLTEEQLFGDRRYDDLTSEEARQQRLAAWMLSGEAALLLRRVQEVMHGD